MSDTIFLGKTTLQRMISAAYDESDPLHSRWIYSECGCARMDVEDGSRSGDEVVYVYYHPNEDQTIMTNIKDDLWGAMDSSAGFRGKLTPEDLSVANISKKPISHEEPPVSVPAE